MSKEMSSEKELLKIGNRLRELRKKKFSSPDTFAYDSKLNRSQYGKYETGRANITIVTLVKILNHLNITLTEFFGEGYENPPPTTPKA